MITWRVDELEAGKRLDVVAALHVPEISRGLVQRLCDDGKVTIDGRIDKTSTRLKPGQRIDIDFDIAELTRVPTITLPVLYEDEDCIVIDKPTGVLTHSKGAFNPEATVATFIRPKLHGLEGDRAGIAHRLDRATSGVIIAAKHPEALSWLQKQFSIRKVKKQYIAIVQGHLVPPKAVIDMPIERHPRRPQTFRVGRNGKPALTAYETLQEVPGFSMLALAPETGRTHQLRVHLRHLDHPIVGDTLYGGVPADRLYLHAHRLEITLPNRQRTTFTSTVPPSFAAYMQGHAV